MSDKAKKKIVGIKAEERRIEWKTGDYAIKDNDSVVLLELLRTDSEGRKWFGVKYVQILPTGNVICGGGSFAWEESRFTPIKEPIQLLAAKAFAAEIRRNQARSEAEKAEEERIVSIAAIKAIKEAA